MHYYNLYINCQSVLSPTIHAYYICVASLGLEGMAWLVVCRTTHGCHNLGPKLLSCLVCIFNI